MAIKHVSLSFTAAICAALLAVPALAQSPSPAAPPASAPAPAAMPAPAAAPAPAAMPAPSSTMKTMAKPAAKKAVKKARAVKRSCLDYAYQSQAEKDCEAGKIKPPSWR